MKEAKILRLLSQEKAKMDLHPKKHYTYWPTRQIVVDKGGWGQTMTSSKKVNGCRAYKEASIEGAPTKAPMRVQMTKYEF